MSGTSRAGVCLSLINNRGKEKGWVDFLEFRDYRPMGMERIGINPDTNLAIENIGRHIWTPRFNVPYILGDI